jgi:hypothetical protein
MNRSLARAFSIAFLVIGFFLASQTTAQDKNDIRRQIADAYGFSSWGQVQQIRYTWNVDAGTVKIARTWTWEPKTDHVTFEGKDKNGKPLKVDYTRGSMSSDVVKNTDPDFINDQYWLLFPFHLVWDKDVSVEDKGMATAPMGSKAKARKVSVTYPKTGGGYTPGDSYDLYLGSDNRIIGWIFHEGGTPKTSLMTTWSDYKSAGPIFIALDHRGTHNDKPIRIFFTDVAVKLAGTNEMTQAK